MDESIIIYAKYDSNKSIISISSNLFIDDLEGWTKIDEWQKGQDKYLYAHADNGEYVQEKHGKTLLDENERPNFHDDFIEWTEEEKQEKYPIVNLDEPTEKEIQEQALNTMMLRSARISFLNELPDEEAVNIPLCFDTWDSYPDGYTFTVGKRVEHLNGRLFKCKKEHQKQASWYQSAEPTLWEELDKEQHEGTLEDPIPVPESVNISGFTYVVGKYYIENEIKYLCKYGETEEGTEIILYYKPSALVKIYFVEV